MDDYEKMRRFKRQAKKMAELVKSNRPKLDFVRMDGGVICPECGLELYDHPEFDGLHLVCSGEWAKL